MKSFDITKTKVKLLEEDKLSIITWYNTAKNGQVINAGHIYEMGFLAGVKSCRKAIRERLKKLQINDTKELQALYVKASPALQLLNKISSGSEVKPKEFVCMKCRHQREMNLLYADLFSKKLCQNCFRKGWRLNNLDGEVYLYKNKKFI